MSITIRAAALWAAVGAGWRLPPEPRQHVGPPPPGSERLRSLRALDAVLVIAEDINEYTCQLSGTLADEEARHIRHSLLHIKDLRIVVNEELVGVGVGDEMAEHGGGTTGPTGSTPCAP